MCRIFAGQDPASYEGETRSIRLNGHSTSIRLERAFWDRIAEMAETEGLTIPQFIARLHDEMIELKGEARNFTSLLRCACLVRAGEGTVAEASFAAA